MVEIYRSVVRTPLSCVPIAIKMLYWSNLAQQQHTTVLVESLLFVFYMISGQIQGDLLQISMQSVIRTTMLSECTKLHGRN